MRGFIQGGLWGLILGGAGLSLASLVTERPDFATGPTAPQLVVPEPDSVESRPAPALQAGSDAAPTFAPATSLSEVSDVAEATPEVSIAPPAPPRPSDVAALEDPEQTSDADVSSNIDAPAAPRMETALIEPAPEGDVPDIDTRNAPALSREDEPVEAPTVAETAEPETSGIEETQSPTTGENAATQTTSVLADTPVVTTEEPAANAAQPMTEGDAVQTEQVTVAQALPQTTTAVRINRPGATQEDPQADVVDTPAADALPDDAPALLRHAVTFADTGAPAKISVMLLDSGEMQDAASAVADIGFIPTVTVNALSPASADLAQTYRAAGIEVAIQAALPDGAQPSDVEVAFAAALGSLPDVAMLFSDGTGAMQDRAVTEQVMQILAADGYGFVTVQRGLSNAARVAEQGGVSAATILRDIDGEGEDRRTIARALDQAAFRARQTGEAVLLGRVKPDTLAALRAWAADLDQDALVIAPVSAILLRAD